MNVLDLFSGIGGFSLGLERAGMHTIAFCEIDAFARKVLAKRWPTVPCFEDVRSLTAEQVGAADVICGGFPCQDVRDAKTISDLKELLRQCRTYVLKAYEQSNEGAFGPRATLIAKIDAAVDRSTKAR